MRRRRLSKWGCLVWAVIIGPWVGIGLYLLAIAKGMMETARHPQEEDRQ
jgi:hypothetical protein